MNYRHAFHAGNFADVAKHLALTAILLHLRNKPTPFAIIDTHAGRGSYDLGSEEARRTNEAGRGIGRLSDLKSELKALSSYLDLVREGGPAAYPGSPLLAARLLRPQDRLVAIEKHSNEASALVALLKPFANARAETADGYARLAALLPPPERRGLVLIDPPYEAEDEFHTVARAFAAAYRRFATGIYAIWFPVKSRAEADGFCSEVLASGAAKVLRLDVALKTPEKDRLSAAGLLVVNPPFRFEDEMRQVFAETMPRLDAAARIDRLAGD
jgi:23S rRNA (adenine2030-N6)-methyltransferase